MNISFTGTREDPPGVKEISVCSQEYVHSSKAVTATCPDLALSLVLFLSPSPEADGAEEEEGALGAMPHPLGHHMQLQPMGREEEL